MPKVSFTVSLPKELYAAIDRLSVLQGASKSSLVVSILEPSLPSLVNMADLIEHLQNASPEERLKLQAQIFQTGQDAENQITTINQTIKDIK